MATVTSEMIKDLRERTGAGMMDCKKALTEVEGDVEGAIDWLRKKGLSAAAKKSGRVAAEGVVSSYIAQDGKKATICEVNCETDFVSQNENFTSFGANVTNHIHRHEISTLDALNGSSVEGANFADYISTTISKIGENIVVRRFATIEAGENGVIVSYTHGNGKIGVLVAADCDSSKTADHVKAILKDIAMHAAAMNPLYLDDSEISQADIDREIEVAKAQLEKEGKPAAMWDKIMPGKISKFKKDSCLVEQPFVKNDKLTVKEALSAAAKEVSGTANLVRFVRFQVGEGIEKAACDFASEVAAALGKN
jgi:elongation factor Ts